MEERKLATGQEWAEVCFVPTWAARSKQGPGYRFLAIRDLLGQKEFPGMEAQLSFSTLNWEEKRYKLFGVVTNRDSTEDKLIWWAIMILALNLNSSKGTRYILKLSQIGLNNTTQAIFPGFVVKTNH